MATQTKAQREKKERDDVTTEAIRETLKDWTPGGWARRVNYGPACSCGTVLIPWHAEGGGVPDGICALHPNAGEFVRAGVCND